MSLWFLFAMMTALAMFAVLWPLGRRHPVAPGGSDSAVYRDQLEELDRDRRAGLIAGREADAARAEIGRRLLAAADRDVGPDAAGPLSTGSRSFRPARPFWRRATAVAVLAGVPVAAVSVYLALGSPMQPATPLAGRQQEPLQERSLASLVAQVEAHLSANPDDVRGWEVIAPVYLRLGRFDDAVKARRNALRLGGATAAREADLGEALTYAANGVVTGEARAAFERALVLDAGEVRARYFMGIAAEQDGRPEEAARLWRALAADAEPDSPWLPLVQAAIARVDPSAAPAASTPGPTDDDVAAAERLSPEERAKMVRGMVAGLAERLRQDGSDVDGWLRLVRAYMVLGEPDRARAAASDARRALTADADKLRRINELLKDLGLES